MHGLYRVEEVSIPSLLNVFVKRMLNFIKFFFFLEKLRCLCGFYSFILSIWHMILVDFHALNHPCLPRINPTWLWYIILFNMLMNFCIKIHNGY